MAQAFSTKTGAGNLGSVNKQMHGLLLLLAAATCGLLVATTGALHPSMSWGLNRSQNDPPADVFSELDFIQSGMAAGNLTQQQWVKQYQPYYQTNVWKIRAKLLAARLRKLGAPLVKFESDEKRDEEPAPPLCIQNDIDNPPSTDFSIPPGGYVRKVYDAVLFLNELDLLEMRLMELEHVVDKFVLVQCPLTFMNNRAELTDVTQLERFRRWWPQIENAYCNLADFPVESKSPWDREKHMRNVMWVALKARANDEDLVTTGDLDELPKAHVIHALRQERNAQRFPVVLHMPMWRFSFACIDRDWKDERQWAGTVVTTGQFTHGRHSEASWNDLHKDGQQVRSGLRNGRVPDHMITCAGWHCSSCLTVDDYVTKISQYSHAPEMPDDYRDRDVVQETAETCMFGVLQRVRSLKGLPRGIVENAGRFGYLLPV